MSRERVLSLYRRIFRLAKSWKAVNPSETEGEKAYIRQEARARFRVNIEVLFKKNSWFYVGGLD